MRESLKKSFLHGVMILWQAIKIIGLFFHPKYFWMVYLCYVMIFLKGFFRSGLFDPNFIDFDIEIRLYTFIDGFSQTSCLALVLWFYAIYRIYDTYKQGRKRIFLLGIVHILLIVLWADNVAEFGDRVAWVFKSG